MATVLGFAAVGTGGAAAIAAIRRKFDKENPQEKIDKNIKKREDALKAAQLQIEKEYKKCDDQRKELVKKHGKRLEDIKKAMEANEDEERKLLKRELRHEMCMEEMRLDHLAQLNTLEKNNESGRRKCVKHYQKKKQEMENGFLLQKLPIMQRIQKISKQLKKETEELEKERNLINDEMEKMKKFKDEQLSSMERMFQEQFSRNLGQSNQSKDGSSKLSNLRKDLLSNYDQKFDILLQNSDEPTRLLLENFKEQITNKVLDMATTTENVCITVSSEEFRSAFKVVGKPKEDLENNLNLMILIWNAYSCGMFNLRSFMASNRKYDEKIAEEIRRYISKTEGLFGPELQKNIYQLQNALKVGGINREHNTIQYFHFFRSKLHEVYFGFNSQATRTSHF